MAEVSAALGAGYEFEFAGQTYKVGPRDFHCERDLECHLEQRDLETVRRHRGSVPADEYEMMLRSWRQDVTAGVWSFGTEKFADYYLTWAGIKKAAFLQLRRYNPAISEAVIDALWKDQEKWKEFNELQGAANSDPLTSGATPTP